MAARKRNTVPTLRVGASDSLKTIYTKADRAFTAADLQKYTELEAGIPARQVLKELEARDRRKSKKEKGKSRNGRTR